MKLVIHENCTQILHYVVFPAWQACSPVFALLFSRSVWLDQIRFMKANYNICVVNPSALNYRTTKVSSSARILYPATFLPVIRSISQHTLTFHLKVVFFRHENAFTVPVTPLARKSWNSELMLVASWVIFSGPLLIFTMIWSSFCFEIWGPVICRVFFLGGQLTTSFEYREWRMWKIWLSRPVHSVSLALIFALFRMLTVCFC